MEAGKAVIKKLLKKILGDIYIELSPPDMIVRRRGRVYVTRYLIGREASIGLYELDESMYRNLIDKYSVVINRLPPASEIKIVKVRTDLGKVLTRISNEILNLKATIETVQEEHVRKKAETKLQILERLYEDVLKGRPIDRIVLVVKIHSEKQGLEDAKRELEVLSTSIKTMIKSMIGIDLVEANRRQLIEVVKYELGLTAEPGGKPILIQTRYPAHLLPLPPRKKPAYEESEKTVPIGTEIETGWPVLLPIDMLNKHIAIIGPTGRGKTTLLALLIESLTSLDETITTVIDFKGDLAGLLSRELVDIVTPRKYPVNILVEPPGIRRVDWLLSVVDTLHNVLGYDREKTSLLLGKRMGSMINNPEEVIIDRELSIFTPIVELLTGRPNYHGLLKLLEKNTLFDLGRESNAYRNTYGGLLVHIYRQYVANKRNDRLRLLIIDEAWRISGLKGLLELIKEGRSRNIGIVLAVQNPGDLPRPILENTHIIIMFGSQNEEYQKQAVRILGVRKTTAAKLKYLGVGEALMINSLDPHPVLIRVNKPIGMNEAMMKGGLTRTMM